MSVIGSMTVSVDATAVKAKRTFRELVKSTKSVGSAIKSIGNIQVGAGKLLSRDNIFGFVRYASTEFVGIMQDIQKLNAEAQKAGKTIEEFTKGAYTQEDVKKAQEFASAMEKLKLAMDGAIKDLVIDIAPEAAEAIRLMAEVVRKGAEVFRFGRRASGHLGTEFGRFFFGEGSQGAISQDEIRRNARRANRQFQATTGGQRTIADSRFTDSEVKNVMNHQLRESRRQTETLGRLERNTRNSGTTVEFREAKLAQ